MRGGSTARRCRTAWCPVCIECRMGAGGVEARRDARTSESANRRLRWRSNGEAAVDVDARAQRRRRSVKSRGWRCAACANASRRSPTTTFAPWSRYSGGAAMALAAVARYAHTLHAPHTSIALPIDRRQTPPVESAGQDAFERRSSCCRGAPSVRPTVRPSARRRCRVSRLVCMTRGSAGAGTGAGAGVTGSGAAVVATLGFLAVNLALCCSSIPLTRFVQELPVWDRRAEAIESQRARRRLLALLESENGGEGEQGGRGDEHSGGGGGA